MHSGTWETCPRRPCRVCGGILPPYKVSLGYTGCSDCERLHLWGQLAEGGRTGVMPDWWINPDTWIDPEEKEAQHMLYEALRWERKR